MSVASAKPSAKAGADEHGGVLEGATKLAAAFKDLNPAVAFSLRG